MLISSLSRRTGELFDCHALTGAELFFARSRRVLACPALVLAVLSLAPSQLLAQCTRLPTPRIALSSTEEYTAGGTEYVRYRIAVSNWQDYSDTLFAAAPHLPPCGLNTKASRSWVSIFDGRGNKLKGFCAFGSASDLQRPWFAVRKGDTPPSSVYLTIQDRQCVSTAASQLLNLKSTSPDCFPKLPDPDLAFRDSEEYTAGGQRWVRYRLTVNNRAAFPDEMFAAAPELPACGVNTNSSRTWVSVFDETGRKVYGFCALGSSEDLDGLWISVPKGSPPPSGVYITLEDRACGNTYTSQVVRLMCSAVRVSVKFVLDADGNRATTGNLNTNDEVAAQIEVANDVLDSTGRGISLDLVEIIDLEGVSEWFDSGCGIRDSLEAAAEADPTTYSHRDDAINIYVLGTTACAGVCSFPGTGSDIIVVGQSLRLTTFLHEIGHYFHLYHTQGSVCGGCDSTQQGVCHTEPGTDEVSDTLPDLSCWNQDDLAQWSFDKDYTDLSDAAQQIVNDTYSNIMSYHSVRSVLTPEQMDRWIDSAASDRSHVLQLTSCFIPSATDLVTSFVRGDPNNDSVVQLSDAVSLLNTLFGNGAELACRDAADANDDGRVDISDPVSILGFLFSGTIVSGLEVFGCEPDATPDDLGSCVYDTRNCHSEQ